MRDLSIEDVAKLTFVFQDLYKAIAHIHLFQIYCFVLSINFSLIHRR